MAGDTTETSGPGDGRPNDDAARLRLLAYRDGELPPADAALVRRALAASADLRRALELLDATWAHIDALPAPGRVDLWPGIQAGLAGERRRAPRLRTARSGHGAGAPRASASFPARPRSLSLPPRLAYPAALALGLAMGVWLGDWATGPRADDMPDLSLFTSLASAPEGSPSALFFDFSNGDEDAAASPPESVPAVGDESRPGSGEAAVPHPARTPGGRR
jgi:hypothetical protein